MPYRIDIPAGASAPQHIYATSGTPSLNAARNAIYDAPETTITLREREAMRFPLTVVIGCDVCNSLRMWRDWPGYEGEPVPEAFYQACEARDLSYPGFTERETLLIRFVAGFDTGVDELNGDEDLWAGLRAHFSEAEIGDIVIMAGAWLGFGRGLKALGVGSVCDLPQDPAEAARPAAAPALS